MEGVCYGTIDTSSEAYTDHDALGDADTVAYASTAVMWSYTANTVLE